MDIQNLYVEWNTDIYKTHEVVFNLKGMGCYLIVFDII